jgi:DedD protein
MERPLKERLVGAVVIVIIGVVFIPLFLDGPDESGRAVEQGLTLPSASQGVRTVTIPVGRSADEPAPVPAPSSADPVAPRPDAGSVKRPAANASTPAAAPSTAAPPAAAPAPSRSAPAPAPSRQAAPAAGDWAVQVGSFSQADNAERLKDKLVADGFQAYTSRVVTDAGTMHRVRVGPVPAREDAEGLLARLTRAGQKGRVVRTED